MAVTGPVNRARPTTTHSARLNTHTHVHAQKHIQTETHTHKQAKYHVLLLINVKQAAC